MDNIKLTQDEKKDILESARQFAVKIDILPIEQDVKKNAILEFIGQYSKALVGTRKST